MSKHALERTIRRELEALNMKIDLKIIKGVSYKQEARRHKFLLAQMQHLSKVSNQSGWFGKLASTVSMAMF